MLCRAVVFCVIPFPTVITLYLLQRHVYNKMADCAVTQVTKIVMSQRTYNPRRSKEGIRFGNYCPVVLISLDVFIVTTIICLGSPIKLHGATVYRMQPCIIAKLSMLVYCTHTNRYSSALDTWAVFHTSRMRRLYTSQNEHFAYTYDIAVCIWIQYIRHHLSAYFR